MQTALFEIEGIPRKKVIRELRSYIAVFPGHIYVEVDGESDDIDIRDVFNIFIQEPLYFDIKSRTTVIDYYFEGEEMRYKLDDGTYPLLSAHMEKMLENYWPYFAGKKQYPDTVRWFNAACTALNIADDLDPHIFGGMFDTMEASVEQKKVLYDNWGVENRAGLRETLDHMQQDGSVWEHVSAIRIAACGFICGYFNIKTALGYCLSSGQSLQTMCLGWDDMMNKYLPEYCMRGKQDLADENSKIYDVLEIHRNLLTTAESPYTIDFFYPLSEDWLK